MDFHIPGSKVAPTPLNMSQVSKNRKYSTSSNDFGMKEASHRKFHSHQNCFPRDERRSVGLDDGLVLRYLYAAAARPRRLRSVFESQGTENGPVA
ncbi:unnamed protein product [Nesidiocoris tenuis]|uniref:Uncharacterized protein n=1 Tax=Nesidiocoris tenuis TaxID=355587 RepID=A0A6H5H4U8_9HEMI|nr:unnamed protein product [Nesidiocoris tenuis]